MDRVTETTKQERSEFNKIQKKKRKSNGILHLTFTSIYYVHHFRMIPIRCYYFKCTQL